MSYTRSIKWLRTDQILRLDSIKIPDSPDIKEIKLINYYKTYLFNLASKQNSLQGYLIQEHTFWVHKDAKRCS